jgi:hypothetical protein
MLKWRAQPIQHEAVYEQEETDSNLMRRPGSLIAARRDKFARFMAWQLRVQSARRVRTGRRFFKIVTQYITNSREMLGRVLEETRAIRASCADAAKAAD